MAPRWAGSAQRPETRGQAPSGQTPGPGSEQAASAGLTSLLAARTLDISLWSLTSSAWSCCSCCPWSARSWYSLQAEGWHAAVGSLSPGHFP